MIWGAKKTIFGNTPYSDNSQLTTTTMSALKFHFFGRCLREDFQNFQLLLQFRLPQAPCQVEHPRISLEFRMDRHDSRTHSKHAHECASRYLPANLVRFLNLILGMGVEPKIGGNPPISSILIGFSIIFAIHFGGQIPLFLETSVSPEQVFCSTHQWHIPLVNDRILISWLSETNTP